MSKRASSDLKPCGTPATYKSPRPEAQHPQPRGDPGSARRAAKSSDGTCFPEAPPPARRGSHQEGHTRHTPKKSRTRIGRHPRARHASENLVTLGCTPWVPGGVPRPRMRPMHNLRETSGAPPNFNPDMFALLSCVGRWHTKTVLKKHRHLLRGSSLYSVRPGSQGIPETTKCPLP